jgi:endonuclease G
LHLEEVNMDREERIAAHVAVRRAESYLMDPRREIQLVDVGVSERDGSDGSRRIRFHVARKLTEPQLESAAVDPLPDRIAGFPREVNERRYRLSRQEPSIGWVPPSARGRNDPLIGGISISDDRSIAAGTLGAIVRDPRTNDRLILSNFHVVAGWGARPGAPRILQPGRLDGGTAGDVVGAFLRHAMDAHLDAAVALLDTTRGVAPRQLGIGSMTARVAPDIGQKVIKNGRTTGRTAGVVRAVAGSGRFRYGGVTWLIRHVLTIEPPHPGEIVSSGGDSGCCWLDADGHHAVALHFAGSDEPERALAIDLGPVCDALGVEVLI